MPNHGWSCQEYLDRRIETKNCLTLTKATVNQIHMAGMGDRVCVDLCSLMKPGEGLLVCPFLFISCHMLFHAVYFLYCYVLLNWRSESELWLRWVPLLEDFFLFTRSAWRLITLLVDHFELTRWVLH